MFLKLSDALVQPAVQYGSESWGLDTAAVHIEQVHLFALISCVIIPSALQSLKQQSTN